MTMIDRWTGAVLLILSFVIAYFSWNLPLGTIRKPGAAFFPLLLAFVLGFLALLLCISSWFKKLLKESKNDQTAKRYERFPKKVFYVLGALLVYALCFETLGFLISTFIFFLFLKPFIERKWLHIVIGAILITILSYLVFELMLKSQLPKGIFGI